MLGRRHIRASRCRHGGPARWPVGHRVPRAHRTDLPLPGTHLRAGCGRHSVVCWHSPRENTRRAGGNRRVCATRRPDLRAFSVRVDRTVRGHDMRNLFAECELLRVAPRIVRVVDLGSAGAVSHGARVGTSSSVLSSERQSLCTPSRRHGSVHARRRAPHVCSDDVVSRRHRLCRGRGRSLVPESWRPFRRSVARSGGRACGAGRDGGRRSLPSRGRASAVSRVGSTDPMTHRAPVSPGRNLPASNGQSMRVCGPSKQRTMLR